MADSRLLSVINALKTECQTAVGAGTTVYLGTPVTDFDVWGSDFDDQQLVIVAGNGDPRSDDEDAKTDQDWRGLGAGTREERIEVRCAVITRYNADDVPDQLSIAWTLFHAIAAALRANKTLGFPPPTVAQIGEASQFLTRFTARTLVRLIFVVAVETRI
jgi:hypothetical protein